MAPLGEYDDELRAVHDASAFRPPSAPSRRAEDSLWGVCTGLLSQTLFTMPLVDDEEAPGTGPDLEDPLWWAPREVRSRVARGEEFDATRRGVDGTVETVERFVRRITEDALQHSPLFRSYNMMHRPSESLVCEDFARGIVSEGTGNAEDHGMGGELGSARVSDVVLVVETGGSAVETTVWGEQDFREHMGGRPSVPVYGLHSMPLGAVGLHCPCDPAPAIGSVCHLPPEACPARGAYSPTASPELYRVCEEWMDSQAAGLGAPSTPSMPEYPRERAMFVHSELSAAMTSGVLAAEPLTCPEFRPSDLWGIPFAVDRETQSLWTDPPTLRRALAQGDMMIDGHELLVQVRF